MGIQMFVCKGRSYADRDSGNPNPRIDLDKILLANPHLSKEGFGTVLTPAPSLPWA